jgi:plastocyanin
LAATPAAKRATQHVSIENVQFNPAQLTVHPGDRIVFTNRDFFPHTVTADDGKSFDSKDIAVNSSWSYRAGKQGVYSYHCTLHPTMKGVITVQ